MSTNKKETAVQSVLRPYATAGVAIVGAGLIAVTPAATKLPDVAAFRDIALTADGSPLGDLLAPWIAQYNEAAQNASVITNNFFLAPAVGAQQGASNQADYWQQIVSDPSSINQVVDEMRHNMAAASSSYTLFDVDQDTFDTTIEHTLDAGVVSHPTILSSFPGLLPPGTDVPALEPLLNFTASPLSGILMGELGPVISPWVALLNSIDAGDGFNETLANMVGAYFNGATLDLDPLLPLINGSGLLPAPTELGHLAIAFGGLFSTGDVAAGPWQLYDSAGNTVASIPAVGGSMLNSLGISLNDVPGVGPIGVTGHAVGPLAAWEGWQQLLGSELGDNWGGKIPGTFNEFNPALPPGTGITFPQIPDDIFGDDSTSSGAAALAAGPDLLGSFTDWLQGLGL